MVTKDPHIINLDFLMSTINSMNKSKNFQSTSKIIFDFVEKLVPCNMTVIYKINKERKDLEVVSCRGSDVNKMKKRVAFKIGEGCVGWVAKEKKALIIEDVMDSNEIQVRQFYDEDPIIRSFLAVPLIVENRLVGILSVSYSKPYDYKENDVEMITIIASQGASLLELNNKVNEAERFSSHILENINSGVIAIDEKYNIVVFNKAAEKITGYTATEVVGKNILDNPMKLNKDDWHIVESYESEEIFFERPAYLIRKDKQKVSIVLSTSILWNENGKKKGSITIFRDNTQIEQLQHQIMRTEKLAVVGRLTAGIAHEIRNPLLPIRTSTQLLLSKVDDQVLDSDSIKLINIINEESERLNRFLDQLVGQNSNKSAIEEKTLLQEVVKDVLLLMNHNLNKHHIQIYVKSPDENIWMPFSKDHLKQIFLNLFFNSIDAINSSNKEVKTIKIEAVINEDKAIIEFSDNGIGISKYNLNKIMDPFYTTKENGTGLGLSIVNRIIDNIGGKVLIDSEIGVGTKFTLILPILQFQEDTKND